MYTKENLKQQLQQMGLTGKETILIHSSMKAIGEVEEYVTIQNRICSINSYKKGSVLRD